MLSSLSILFRVYFKSVKGVDKTLIFLNVSFCIGHKFKLLLEWWLTVVKMVVIYYYVSDQYATI